MQAMTCGIQMKIDAITKMSTPTVAGIEAKKYTDPTIKEIFPSIMRKALREPILLRGLNGENIG